MFIPIAALVVSLLSFVVAALKWAEIGPEAVRARLFRPRAQGAWAVLILIGTWSVLSFSGAADIVQSWDWAGVAATVSWAAAALAQHGDLARLALMVGAVGWIVYVATRHEEPTPPEGLDLLLAQHQRDKALEEVERLKAERLPRGDSALVAQLVVDRAEGQRIADEVFPQWRTLMQDFDMRNVAQQGERQQLEERVRLWAVKVAERIGAGADRHEAKQFLLCGPPPMAMTERLPCYLEHLDDFIARRRAVDQGR